MVIVMSWRWHQKTENEIKEELELQKTLDKYRSEYGSQERLAAMKKNEQYYRQNQKKKDEMKMKRKKVVTLKKRGKNIADDKNGNVFRITYKQKISNDSPQKNTVYRLLMKPSGKNYYETVVGPNQTGDIVYNPFKKSSLNNKQLKKTATRVMNELKKADIDEAAPPLDPFYPEGGPIYLEAKKRFL